MASQWLRRASRWLVAGAAGLLLAACGSGNIESQLTPARIVAFGDAFADLGQNGARYTLNDGSKNNWTQFVAEAYGRTLTASAAGGLSFATGNARVAAKPDAAGNAATPTVQEQIDAFLAGNAIGTEDLFIVNGGTSDVIVQVAAARDGLQTREQMLDNVGAAGRDLADQVRRLVDAGGKFVVVVGPYNMERSPWGVRDAAVTALLKDAAQRFNDQLLINIVDLGRNVLYVDAALYFNLVTSAPGNYSIDKHQDPVCTSADPGPGIGTGSGEINSNLCTSGTVVAGANPELWLFADRVYPSPRGHRLFGQYAYDRIHERW